MDATPLDTLIKQLSRLPGIGARSSRRMALHLLKHKQNLMLPLAESLRDVAMRVQACHECGNWDVTPVCHICTDAKRDKRVLCVVETVADLWALERSHAFRGVYHVLGGTLSALDGVTPEQLRLPQLVQRCQTLGVAEVILALNATVDGQTTAHYIAHDLSLHGLRVTRLAHGVPMGGELDYLDDGTLTTALQARLLA